MSATAVSALMPIRHPRPLLTLILGLAVVSPLISCGQDIDLEATIDTRVQQALAAMPSVTPQPTATPQLFPTPLPTATPQTIPTPLPTATPQPAPTLVPTSTPHPGLGPSPTPVTLPADLYADLRLSVVKIRAGSSFGSGWAIEEGWIITNAHVVDGSSSVTVEVPLPDGGIVSRTGAVRGIDTKRDLAAIQVNHGAPVLPVRIVTAEDTGEQIVHLGYSVQSTGGFPVMHAGVITTVIRHLGLVLEDAPARADRGDDTGGVGVVVFDAAADPGDSGGPVVDMQGNVVAITFGAIVSSSGGKRVIGQQQGTAVQSIEAVWEDLKDGVNTTSQ